MQIRWSVAQDSTQPIRFFFAELTSSTRSSSRSRSRSPSSTRSRSRSPPSPSSLRSIWTKFHQLQRGEWLLQRLCGSATRATVIWEVGLPNTFRIPFRWVSILTENEDTADAILNWLSRLGDSQVWHREDPSAAHGGHARSMEADWHGNKW